ncbi:MAG: hypothetical protein WBR33_02475 [Pseudonocardiaceae bacterium]
MNTIRSTRRGGQSGLADPPAFIPTLVIDTHLHEASQLQTLSRGLYHIARQRRLPHQTNGVTYAVVRVPPEVLTPSFDVLAALTRTRTTSANQPAHQPPHEHP